MADIQTFQKIRDIRDRDKQQAQKKHQDAVDSFEDQAQRLYEVLKEKEERVDQFNQTLAEHTVHADAFVQHQRYIQRLEEKIAFLQPEVQQARVNMKHSQVTLSAAHIEVKKFDTLIESKEQKKLQWLKSEENKHMDELSMQQYLNFQNR